MKSLQLPAREEGQIDIPLGPGQLLTGHTDAQTGII